VERVRKTKDELEGEEGSLIPSSRLLLLFGVEWWEKRNWEREEKDGNERLVGLTIQMNFDRVVQVEE